MDGMYHYALADQDLTSASRRNKREGRSAKSIGRPRRTTRPGRWPGSKKKAESKGAGEFEELGTKSWRFRRDSAVGPEVRPTLAKRLPAVRLFVCGPPGWEPRRGPSRPPLTEMDPDVAKEDGGKFTEEFNMGEEDLPAKSPRRRESGGPYECRHERGNPLVPSKGFREDNDVPKDAEKTAASACATFSCLPPTSRLATANRQRRNGWRMMKLDSEGNEHDTALPRRRRQTRRRGTTGS